MEFQKIWLSTLTYLLCFPCLLFAQTVKKPKRDHGYVNPKIMGMGETKGISLNYERLLSSSIYANNDFVQVDENERIEFKLKVPILLKPGLKLGAGFTYKSEEMEFEGLDAPSSLYFNALTQKPLKSIEGKFMGIKTTKGNHYYLFQAGVRFSGDYESDQLPLSRFMRLAVSGLVGWKLNNYTSWGIGAQYSYRNQQHLVFPTLMFNKTFNNKWGIETLLPVKANVRYNISDNSRLYGGLELKRASYFIFLDEVSSDLLELTWTEVRLGMTYEREIHDFLWMSVSGGVRDSFGLDITKAPNPVSGSDIFNARPGFAPYFNVSLFLVPPKKWRR